MAVYKHKNSPYYHFDFQIEGVRFHGSTSATRKAKALQVEANKRHEVALYGKARKRKPMSLNEAAGRYMVEVSQHQASAYTTEYQLANLVAALRGDTLLSEITDDQIAEYVARRRAKVSNASVNREVQLLRRVFRRAHGTWRRDVGDMPDWRCVMLPEPSGRIRELRIDEESRFLKALREDMHPLVRFCLMTGVRLMNAARLTWSQVDFDNGEIVLRTKSRKPGGDIHMVPITRAMRLLLRAQHGRHAIFVFTYVCKRSRGKRRKDQRYPFSRNGWRKDWKAALKAAGIEDFRFHDLRHTAATRTLRASNNLKVVQEMLGHADIATTARYAHALKDDVRAAMEAAQSRNSPEIAEAPTPKELNTKA